ncbi:hypothetical protein NIES2100_05950 [Calothrix sp. NIES-2100]|uniref:YbjN domain-containing protein n=1 Tax=Calothrix sp. NIES-2100 TaxID=1954172 RepID=UPI000B601B27|nr:hypothetical protein NIES2100_05950 [Calothrix sp. NIES-2100]
MGNIFDAIVDFLTEDDWDFSVQSDRLILQMRFQGDTEQWVCYAKAKEEDEQFLFFSVSPVNAPITKRLTVAELITRINYSLPIGNFEMDFDDGEIRYKTSIDVEGSRLDSALIAQIVHANVQVMNTYLRCIMAVIDDNISPLEALAAINETR